MWDVVVVGAGPAGAAAALAARRGGASVLLLDRSDFPRDKVCGDGIAAHTLGVLAGLGVRDAVAGYAPVARLRLIGPGGDAVERELPRVAYTVPRAVFDARLVDAAVAAGAELRRHTVRAVRDIGDRVVLDDTIEARVVVGADGAGSVVRRALGHPVNPPGHLAFAIRGYAASPETVQHIVTTRDRWPAYAWVFPIGDGRANVGYGEVLRGAALSRPYLLGRLRDLVPDVEPTGLRAHHLPLSTHRPPPSHGRILLAGDALSLINPFTGEGIFYAVLSGALAGAAAAGGHDYPAALRARLGRHLRHSSVATRLTKRPWVVDAAIRAAARDQRVFARVVDLGLGDGTFDARTVARIVADLRPANRTADR
jgi:geranylgeranyl reductase family protein